MKTKIPSSSDILFILETVLIGVAITFGIEALLQGPSRLKVLAFIAFIVAVVNFYHGKMDLALDEDFRLLVGSRSGTLGISAFFLTLLTLGSFLFMPFFLDKPKPYLVSHAVMRFSDAVLDAVVLRFVKTANLDEEARRELKQTHKGWLVVSAVIGLIAVAEALLMGVRWGMTPTTVVAVILIAGVADVLSDYVRNWRVYFQSPRFRQFVPIVHEQSREFVKAQALYRVLSEDLKTSLAEPGFLLKVGPRSLLAFLDGQHMVGYGGLIQRDGILLCTAIVVAQEYRQRKVASSFLQHVKSQSGECTCVCFLFPAGREAMLLLNSMGQCCVHLGAFTAQLMDGTRRLCLAVAPWGQMSYAPDTLEKDVVGKIISVVAAVAPADLRRQWNLLADSVVTAGTDSYRLEACR